MNVKNRLILVAGVILTAPFVSHAGSLECQGNIISPGATEQELLDACGEPTSRNGANWVYHVPGSIPVIVTFGNGVATFIRDVESEDSPASPHGDNP